MYWRKRKWGWPGHSGPDAGTSQQVALGTIAMAMSNSCEVLWRRMGWIKEQQVARL